MKIGKLIFSIRKANKPSHEEIVDAAFLAVCAKMRSDLADSNSNMRQMIAKIVRSVAKDCSEETLETLNEIVRATDGHVRAVISSAPYLSMEDLEPVEEVEKS